MRSLNPFSKTVTTFLLLISFTVCSWAQTIDMPPTTTMALELTKPLNFVYASQQDLLEQKILPQAITLKLKVKQEACLVAAHVTINNNPTSSFANKFVLRMSQTNSLDVNTSPGDINLGPSPRLLFIQPGSVQEVKQYQYLFDLKLNPPDTYGDPVFTNFSIVYTISLQ